MAGFDVLYLNPNSKSNIDILKSERYNIEFEEANIIEEKISFEEPYQAIKFSDKESCCKYLKEKYNDYTDPEVAHPFIMENNEYIDI